MIKMYYWENYTDEELLKLKIKDLGLHLKDTWVGSLQKKLYAELAKKGLKFTPHCWISEDWFTPDGIPGIAIPFYILHPRLQKLEMEKIGEVEGGNPDWCLKLLRHEAGHAIDNAFHLRKSKKRQTLFGQTSIQYPEDYAPKPFSKNYVTHLGPSYAQAHPDEDWAETFAIWLGPLSKWQDKYKNWPALKKLNLLDEIMASIIGKSPINMNKETMDELKDLDITLGEYYEQKQKRFQLNRPNFFHKELNELFPTQDIKTLGYQEKREICRVVAKQTKQYQYNIKRALNEIMKTLSRGTSNMDKTEKRTKEKITNLLISRAPEFIEKGYHRIIM